jgi:secondary thiamine-phosphate synthase enzyme
MSAMAVDQERLWTVRNEVVTLRTREPRQFIEVTELVQERVRLSGVADGIVLVQSQHTTASVMVNEDEPLLLSDMDRLLERLVPQDLRYGHDDFSRRAATLPAERTNGASHCRSLLLGAGQTIPVCAGRLQLGCWQRIFFVELDGPQARSLSILVMGLRGPRG